MAFYLSPDDAIDKLIDLKLYTEDTVPSEEEIEFLLESIEALLDEWIGGRLDPTDYTESTRTNSSGIAFLRNVPVVMVLSVERFSDLDVNRDRAIKLQNVNALWRQGATIDLGAGYPDTALRVAYRAGYDPLPKIISQTVFQLLRSTLKASGTTGDLSFLNAPPRDVTSISIPGISKSFGSGGGGGGGGPGGEKETVFNRLVKPLERYRRRYVL